MITKAYIVQLPIQNSNIFKVRIPIFETASIGQSDNSLSTSICDATLSHNPGSYDNYKLDDCVFVSFEDNLPNDIIILGKLFIDDTETIGYSAVAKLKVMDSAELPSNTTINGVDLSAIQDINNINAKLSSIDLKSTDLFKSNVSVTLVPDSTYENYPFKGTIDWPEITDDYLVDAYFNGSILDSEDSYPIIACDTGQVYIWGTAAGPVVIQTLLARKVVE